MLILNIDFQLIILLKKCHWLTVLLTINSVNLHMSRFHKYVIRLNILTLFFCILLFATSCMIGIAEQDANHLMFPNLDFAQKKATKSVSTETPDVTFQVVELDNFIEVNVETHSEVCIAGIELQRAEEGGIFTKIAQEIAFGDSLGAAYLLIDHTFAYNQNMDYRLKILNLDGTYELTNNQSILVDKTVENVSLISNPTKPKRFLEVDALKNGVGEIAIFDAAGKQISAQKVSLKAGENWSKLPLSNVKNGVYFVALKVNNKRWMRKLIKLS